VKAFFPFIFSSMFLCIFASLAYRFIAILLACTLFERFGGKISGCGARSLERSFGIEKSAGEFAEFGIK
jgi:hypothetical protein